MFLCVIWCICLCICVCVFMYLFPSELVSLPGRRCGRFGREGGMRTAAGNTHQPAHNLVKSEEKNFRFHNFGVFYRTEVQSMPCRASQSVSQWPCWDLTHVPLACEDSPKLSLHVELNILICQSCYFVKVVTWICQSCYMYFKQNQNEAWPIFWRFATVHYYMVYIAYFNE